MNEDNRSFIPEAVSDREAHPLAEDLARYVDYLREPRSVKLPGPIAEHLENCPACQSQVLDVFFYLQDPLREPDSSSAAKIFQARKLRQNWLYPAMRIAAAAFVFILLMTFHLSRPRRQALDYPEESKRAPQLSDSVASSRPLPALAPAQHDRNAATIRQDDLPLPNKGDTKRPEKRDAFAFNTNLESMVGSRSRGLTIEVYSPPNHVTLAQEITFAWKEFSREPLNLTIVNNRNESIFKSPVSGGVFLFRVALPSGCYYWKLESASELYYVGKFFVRTDLKSPKV
jgi:hypothetical protein